MDHFLSIKGAYPLLFRCENYELQPAEPAAAEEGRAEVRARVRGGGAETVFVFRLERRELGSKKGCWLTKQLLSADSKYL